jgi:hypothetical protein
MSILVHLVTAATRAKHRARGQRPAHRGDRGASTIETVIIAASLAALALATMATITLLVDGKVAGIHL